MSIVNGLFAGRAGINSHGAAIAVVGDNISNSSTVGFKSSRAEFEDLIAGGQVSGRTIGSGSSLAAVTTSFTQGTLEFTSRPLDLAIDGNGLFVVADGAQRYYTRAGNFKVDSAGYIVDQNDYALLGFPQNGSGALEPININNVSSSTTPTANVSIAGNLDADAAIVTAPQDTGVIATADVYSTANPAIVPASPMSYVELNNLAEFQTVVDVIDSLGATHTVTLFFFRTNGGDTAAPNDTEWTIQAYTDAQDVSIAAGPADGTPVLIGEAFVGFDSDGTRNGTVPSQDITASNIPWSNGADSTQDVDFLFDPFTQFAANSNISAITQDGQGVGAVTSISVESDGRIFALLDNGQSTILGTVGLVNFANPAGLQRIGSNLLQQSGTSGEPIVGKPADGTFGSLQAGSLELSNVDLASEFVKVITLQRGFQASSRIISTIDQLLSEIIQLA
ncbi:MAG: flagellar hook protein FlgE [Bdellovibrionales bacterium]|nr:flagellar hook protein FlgE [Bdellovibrionales bacterium]